MLKACQRECVPEGYQPDLLAEKRENVPEYTEILCKSVQIFQKGRKSGTLCILRKLWKVIVHLVHFADLSHDCNKKKKGAAP